MVNQANTSTLDYVLNEISKENPIHGKRLKKNLSKKDEAYKAEANAFFLKYNDFAQTVDRDLDYGIHSYLRMLSDIVVETMIFHETGEYNTKSFEEADERVYNNPEIMEYYMHALLMSQYLWVHHHDIYLFFQKHLPAYKSKVTNYLEIGAGHGMYISEAISIFGDNPTYDIVDLSPTSIDISKKFLKSDKVNYNLVNIFDYEPNKKYDFITMGEVLEHVEDPLSLLNRVSELLTDDGCLFLTVPANAPAIDHIYLFKNDKEIKELCEQAGFKFGYEYYKYVEDVPAEIAERMKIASMYGAFLTKK